MCPNCRAFITTDDKFCPYCEAQLGARAADRRSSYANADHFWTTVLLLINVGMYGASLLLTSQGSGQFSLDPGNLALHDLGAKWLPSIRDGQWWRLITAGFLHGDIFHILMNSYGLYILGSLAESSFGLARFWTIYVVSTFTGFLASYYFVLNLSVGASAAIFGLMGALIALGTREKYGVAALLRGQLIGWGVLNLVLGFIPGSNIDNAAHIGGFIGGFAVAYVAGSPTHRQSVESVWKFSALVSLGVTLYCFVQMYFWLTRPMANLRLGALW